MSELEDLKQNLNKEGFYLESRVMKSFIDAGCSTQINVDLPFGFRENEPPADIDVIAKSGEHIFFCECKGSSPLYRLVLFKNYSRPPFLPVYEIHKKEFTINEFPLGIPNEVFYCHSGHFLKPDAKRPSNRDYWTNFYHGLRQITENFTTFLIAGLQENNTLGFKTHQSSDIFVPMLVTNAKILVADYFDPLGNVIENVRLAPVPWAIVKNNIPIPFFDLSTVKFWNYKTTSDSRIAGKRELPFIWVVHVENIGDFVKMVSTNNGGAHQYYEKPEWI